MKIPKNIYIIGAGGVTSYLLPPLLKTLSYAVKDHPTITIFDGDKLEERNFERQLFDRMSNKLNKALALIKAYETEYVGHIKAEQRYFTDGIELEEHSLLFVCVDNHPARRAALTVCDRYFCNAIIAANEYIDSQSIWYSPFSQGTSLDPRVRYPEIQDDESDDPIRPRGCNTEEALAAVPQLAIANFSAAEKALQIFWFYYSTVEKMDPSSRDHWPIEHSNNINSLTTRTEKDYAAR